MSNINNYILGTWTITDRNERKKQAKRDTDMFMLSSGMLFVEWNYITFYLLDHVLNYITFYLLDHGVTLNYITFYLLDHGVTLNYI